MRATSVPNWASGRCSPARRRGWASSASRTGWTSAASDQRAAEFPARAAVELGIHLAQVVLDGARADEELRADLRVRLTFARQTGDLRLLRGQIVVGVDAATARGLAGGQQLAPRSFRER